MFSEYAALYARIVGWTTSFKPAPMSLEEGQSIQEQASNFVHSIMTPLLGYVHTSKVHKLLAHLMDSIRYHGNLNNANTSANEAAHKADKKFYRRTNMEIATFTEQLVRQAQGAREVVRRHDAADAATLLSHPRVAADAAVTTGGILAAATGGSGVAPTSGGGAALPGVSGVVPPGGSGTAPPGGSGAMPPGGGGGAAPPGGGGAAPPGPGIVAPPGGSGAAPPGGSGAMPPGGGGGAAPPGGGGAAPPGPGIVAPPGGSGAAPPGGSGAMPPGGGGGAAPPGGGGAAPPGPGIVAPPGGSGAAPPGGTGAMPPGGGGAAPPGGGGAAPPGPGIVAPPGGSGAAPAGGFGPAPPNGSGAALPGGGGAALPGGGGAALPIGRSAAPPGGGGAAPPGGSGAALPDGGGAAPSDGSGAAAVDGGVVAWTGGSRAAGTCHAMPSAGTVNAVPAVRRRSANHLKRIAIGTLSERPGLALVAQLFKLQPEDKVPVLSTVELSASFDCGFRSKQLVRASPSFRNNKPWYDGVIYAVESDAPIERADGATAESRDARQELHIGEVRALVRCVDDDYAVVCEFDPVPAEAGCPFDARECDRLKWAGSAATAGGVIRGVPLRMVRRLVHIVPDFKDLAARKGLQAAPAGYNSSPADLHAMRYFANAFHPWG